MCKGCTEADSVGKFADMSASDVLNVREHIGRELRDSLKYPWLNVRALKVVDDKDIHIVFGQVLDTLKDLDECGSANTELVTHAVARYVGY